MRKYTLLLGFFIGLAFSQLYGQISVTHVDAAATAPNRDGVFYTLPRTVIKVDVTLRIEERYKGPLSEYAERFYGIDDAINFDNTFYEIEEVNISTFTEPDPGQIYYIQAGDPESKELKLLLVQLDESGFLVSANNLDTELSSGANVEEIVIDEEIEFNSGNRSFVTDSKIRAKIDTIIRKVVVDTAMTKKLFYRARIVDKTNEEMATEAMVKIRELREARHQLLTGFQETAYSATTLAYMVGELRKQEAEYMALFRGKSFNSYDQFTYYYTPQEDAGANGVTLFNFSSNTGITKAGSSSGEKAILKFVNSGLADVIDNFPEAVKTENDKPGIYYRIPEISEVMLEWDDEILTKTRIAVNQFGSIRNLTGNDFKVEMNTATGGVKSIIVR
jgi:hypothetical protein